MGELFSTLTKHALGVFSLAAGLPAVALVLGGRLLVVPSVPAALTKSLDPVLGTPEWQAGLMLVAVVLIAAVMAGLEGPITRLYEGYPMRSSRLGEWMTRRHRVRVREGEIWWGGVRGLLRAMDRHSTEERAGWVGWDSSKLEELDEAWNRLAQRLVKAYPREGRALPTRLGNAIRAFEDYPLDQYGIYAVTMWPRLLSVVPEQELKRLGSSKEPMSLMINSSLVSVLLAALVLVSGLVWPKGHGDASEWILWSASVAVLVCLGYAFYQLAIARAVAWGENVKAVFDLHRWQLLEDLRIAGRPKSMTDERKLWRSVGGHMLFGRMTTYPPLEYSEVSEGTESVRKAVPSATEPASLEEPEVAKNGG